MNYRALIVAVTLVLGAAGSWLLVTERRPRLIQPQLLGTRYEGYYLIDATMKGIGSDGQYLYEIKAHEASQDPERGIISMTGVELAYAPSTDVPWTLTADTGIVDNDSQKLTLSGNVRVSSNGDDTAIRLTTDELEIDPENYLARTSRRVTIRVGARSLSATGMLAFLNEDRLELQSNVSGKFLP